MICRILLLISLNCVCGTFVVNVTQTSYQAEENHNITLEWTFTTTAHTSPDSLYIFCQMINARTVSALFDLYEGVEVPESRDQQFVGRVQWDKDVLRDRRLRLHMSRLRTEDSGRYRCNVWRNNILNSSECRLTVSAARDPPEPERSNTDSPEKSNWHIWGIIALFSTVVLALVVMFVVYLSSINCLFDEHDSVSDYSQGFKQIHISVETEETVFQYLNETQTFNFRTQHLSTSDDYILQHLDSSENLHQDAVCGLQHHHPGSATEQSLPTERDDSTCSWTTDYLSVLRT